MTEPIPEAWRGHRLVADWKQDDSSETVLENAHCGGCAEVPAADLNPNLWFATHLENNGGTAYAVEFERGWRLLVSDRGGRISVDQLARELSDYSVVMGEASKVYEELAGLSKPNTAARHVIQGAEDRFAETYAGYLLDAAKDSGPEGLTRDELAALAEMWHPGAVEAHEQAQAWMADVRAKIQPKDATAASSPAADAQLLASWQKLVDRARAFEERAAGYPPGEYRDAAKSDASGYWSAANTILDPADVEALRARVASATLVAG